MQTILQLKQLVEELNKEIFKDEDSKIKKIWKKL